jgi:hypothetical protein
MLAANPASAAPKKKKAAAAAPAEAEAAPAADKDTDQLMQESATKPKGETKAAESESMSEAVADEDVGEPDAWERPPVEEEKPKAAPAAKVVESYGDGNRIEIVLAPGYGFKMGDADWSTVDPYTFGLALRGGYELDNRVYLGAGFVYYLGTTKDDAYIQRGASMMGPITIKANYMLAYLEGGYDFWFDDLLLRPSLWLGMGFAFVDPHFILGGLKTVTDFMFAPGLGVFYVWDGWMIGGDVRYTAVTGDGVAGLTIFGNIGLRF